MLVHDALRPSNPFNQGRQGFHDKSIKIPINVA